MGASNEIASAIVHIAARAHHNFRGSPYHYIPTRAVAITFIVLYSISTIAHVGQAGFYRMWWLLPTAGLCGLLEIIGWSARLWSSFSPALSSPFQMQITATILGPTPLLAANFVIFGTIIRHLGPQYSRLSPKWYTILFCTCDVISLVVQAIGGGKAAVASGNGLNPTPGGNIMLGGISFQLLTITVYAMCASEFYVRYSQDWPILTKSGQFKYTGELPPPRSASMSKKITIMSAALLFSTTTLFIRAVYRTIELSNGWDGRIISTQVLFNVLDGAMVTLALYTMNFFHPGYLLGPARGPAPAPAKIQSDTASDTEKRGESAIAV